MVMSFSFYQTVFRSEKLRFGAVGVVNTVIDFSILFLLTSFFAVPAIFANIVSTSVALCVSFLLNKRAVFKNTSEGWGRQLVLFAAITLTGLWGLQTIVILTVVGAFEQFIGHTWVLLVAKLIATIASLAWNYLWYSRVVFRSASS